MNLDFGISRLRKSGTDGGHNGLKDINSKLNTISYPRLRFGIGNNFKDGKQIDFVLEKWNDDETKNLSKLILGKEINKSFFVKNRLINILLK